MDQPGKDSYEHRQAGASEVIVSSARRWVQMHELTGEARGHARRSCCGGSRPATWCWWRDSRRSAHPKLEVFRKALGMTPLHLRDERIVAVAADQAFPGARIPVVDLNDVGAIAELVRARAAPLPAVLAALETSAKGSAER